MWNRRLTKYVSKVGCTNFRLLATKFSFPEWTCLLLNVYFPCDPRVDNFDDTELVNLLADMRNLIVDSGCQNVLIAGDLNCHFERLTQFTNIVKEELDELKLSILWQQPEINVDYTYCCTINDNLHFSTIDHFALCGKLVDAVVDAG